MPEKRAQKKPGLIGYDEAGHRPGNDLLSQGLSPHYHRRNSVSLPGSEWDRVVPPCYGHQRTRFMRCCLKSYVLKKRPPVTLAVIAEMIEFVLLGLGKDRLK